MKALKGMIVTVALLSVVQVAAPAGSVPGPAVAHAQGEGSGGGGGGPWWAAPVTWLVTNCITSWETGSWYDRVVCRRAVRFIRWVMGEAGDVMCLGKFYDVAIDPTHDRIMELNKCLLDEGLPTVKS